MPIKERESEEAEKAACTRVFTIFHLLCLGNNSNNSKTFRLGHVISSWVYVHFNFGNFVTLCNRSPTSVFLLGCAVVMSVYCTCMQW